MLHMLNIRADKIDFHEFVLIYGKGETLYRSIDNKLTDHVLMENKDTQNMPCPIPKKPLLLTSVPGYLDTHSVFEDEMILKKVKTFPGSLINLTAYTDFESYLAQNFNNKRRSYFKQCENRLRTSFEISHRVYYGAIEIEVYDRVFNAFQKMQTDRFEQLGIKDDAVEMWPVYKDHTRQLVIDKKACISVIYAGREPIAISLNYLMGKAVFGFTKTFDMAYAKFGLGNVELLKMIAWCYGQGFEILDFMKGEYTYKNRFTDHAYSFITHVAYSNENLKYRLWGLTTFGCQKLFYAFYHLYRFVGLHKIRHRTGRKNIKASPIKVQKLVNKAISISTTETKIHIEEIKNKHFQKAIYDFCYKHKLSLNTIELYTTKVGANYVKLIGPNQSILLSSAKIKFNKA